MTDIYAGKAFYGATVQDYAGIPRPGCSAVHYCRNLGRASQGVLGAPCGGCIGGVAGYGLNGCHNGGPVSSCIGETIGRWNDRLVANGGWGDDRIGQYGGFGDDSLSAYGGYGNDRINQGGGRGNDHLHANGGWGNDRINQNGGRGNDHLHANGGRG
ncbi:MAG: hypothetical protein HY319_03725, partial [Armatimonadetes bacterium]|nr:hypothetical protein [Armatimonadota bacterium]